MLPHLDHLVILLLQVKNKVEQIKSTVSLPYHYFSGGEKLPEVCPEVRLNHPRLEDQHCTGNITEKVKLEEVVHLEIEPHNSESTAESAEADDGMRHRKWLPPLPENCSGGLQSECDIAEGLASPSDLAFGFEKCSQSINERSSHQNRKPSQEPEVKHQLKPFDHAADVRRG